MKSLVTFLVLATAPGFVTAMFAAEISTVEEIIAKCNGDIVSRGDLDRARRDLIGELRQSGVSGAVVEQKLAEKEKDLLRDRIDQLLLVQKAKDLDIKVDSDVAKRVAAMQTESGIADPDKFHDWVKEQSGMSFEDFKDQMKKSLVTQRVIREEVSDKVSVKHEELEKYYNEHKSEFVREEKLFIREILISTEGKDDTGVAAAEKKAKDLVARARRGERFASRLCHQSRFRLPLWSRLPRPSVQRISSRALSCTRGCDGRGTTRFSCCTEGIAEFAGWRIPSWTSSMR